MCYNFIMRKNIIILKTIILVLVLGIIFIIPGFLNLTKVFAEEDMVFDDGSATVVNREVRALNDDIQDKKSHIKEMQDKQKGYSEAIEKRQGEEASLNNQLAILENRLAKAELDIEIVEIDIERIKLEIQKTDLEIENKNKEIKKEKEQIENVLNLLNKRDYITSLEIILLNDSFADFLSQVKYLEDINESINESLDVVKKLKRQLINEREALDKQNTKLVLLKEDLGENEKKLASEQDNKVVILGQVKDSEREYQRLLEQAKKEQEQAAAEIASMEKLVRAKISELEGQKLEFNDNGFIWPVPKNVITSYFHDPDYPFRYIFEHPGVDIRAGQGTTLKASASGYVARIKRGLDGGYGYIMLIHGDGLSTVYGHISKAYVQEDDYVVQGQTVGLTGGLPGTPGAGRLTTGPHLHFEVRLNGIPVDPLSYLP